MEEDDYENEFIIECIENKYLDKLPDIFKIVAKYDNNTILKKIIESNDYDIITLFGMNVKNSNIFNENYYLLNPLFEEKEILKLLINNNTDFVSYFSQILMKTAIILEDFEIIKLLIKKINYGASILVMSISKGVSMVEALIDIGINIKDNGVAFRKAIQTDNFDMVQYLYEKKFNTEFLLLNIVSNEMMKHLISLGINKIEINRLLEVAFINDNVSMIEYLINNGADEINLNYNYFKPPNFDIFKLLIDNKINLYNYKLFSCISGLNKEHLQYMIDNGLDIHYNYDILLSISVKNENMENIVLLLENGAFVHTNGNEPLRIAAMNGNIEIVKCLIDYTTMSISNNHFLLSCAVVSGSLLLVKYFVDNYFTPNKEALRYSVLCDHIDIFEYFINNVFPDYELLYLCFTTNHYYISVNRDNRNNNNQVNNFSGLSSVHTRGNLSLFYSLITKMNIKNLDQRIKNVLIPFLENDDEYGILDYLGIDV